MSKMSVKEMKQRIGNYEAAHNYRQADIWTARLEKRRADETKRKAERRKRQRAAGASAEDKKAADAEKERDRKRPRRVMDPFDRERRERHDVTTLALQKVAHKLSSTVGVLRRGSRRSRQQREEREATSTVIVACTRLRDDDPTLVELRLGAAIAVNGKGIHMLAKALRHSTHLRALFLYDANLNASCVEILCEGLRQNKGLVNLNLGENDIGFVGSQHLIELLKVKPTLYQLYLDWYVNTQQQKQEIKRLLAVNKSRSPIRYEGHHTGFRGVKGKGS